MAMDYCRQTLNEFKKEFRERCNFHNPDTGVQSKYLTSATGKGGYWVLREYWDPRETEKPVIDIIYIKIHQTKGEVGHNAISADMHPFYYDCPPEWLDRYNPTCQTGIEWKAIAVGLRDFRVNFKFGMVYKFRYCKSCYYRVITDYSKKYYLVRNAQGGTYRVEKDSIDVSFAPVMEFPT